MIHATLGDLVAGLRALAADEEVRVLRTADAKMRLRPDSDAATRAGGQSIDVTYCSDLAREAIEYTTMKGPEKN